jgi:hypothetical protein
MTANEQPKSTRRLRASRSTNFLRWRVDIDRWTPIIKKAGGRRRLWCDRDGVTSGPLGCVEAQDRDAVRGFGWSEIFPWQRSGCWRGDGADPAVRGVGRCTAARVASASAELPAANV